jgi:hypothetical protein
MWRSYPARCSLSLRLVSLCTCLLVTKIMHLGASMVEWLMRLTSNHLPLTAVGFKSWQRLCILSCEKVMQLAYRTSVVLLRCLFVHEIMHGRSSSPSKAQTKREKNVHSRVFPNSKLEYCHMVITSFSDHNFSTISYLCHVISGKY